MSQEVETAERYARAAFEVATDERDVAGWSADLARIAELFSDAEVSAAFDNPQLDDGKRVGLALSIAPDGLKPERVNFLKLVVYARRTHLLPLVVTQLQALVDEAEGRVEVEVVTATPLDAAGQTALVKGLADKLGKEARINARVDPRILGGLVIRQGDRVTDGSVRRRLQELREELIAG